MDKDVRDYREKHPSCEWCKHCDYKVKLEWVWKECELNHKWQKDFLNKIRARFCKYYRVKEED